MIITHYGHRLPADYDLAQIRARSQQRGPVWDDAPGLHFKAFLLRERGRFGAAASSFSSLYLWRHEDAFRDWLMRGGYRIVTDSFGRAPIETFTALDACRGGGREARFLYRKDVPIPADADLTSTLAAEIAGLRDVTGGRGIVAAIAGLDPGAWKFTRILLSEDERDEGSGVGYQVMYLSRPLLEELPRSA